MVFATRVDDERIDIAPVGEGNSDVLEDDITEVIVECDEVQSGLGILHDIEDLDRLIPAVRSFRPDPSRHEVYDRSYQVFTRLHQANQKFFRELNAAASK